MNFPVQTSIETDVRYDASVAGAMNRVLEAERAAQSAIADFELQMHASLEHARQRRRTILERAHERIMALHARSVRSLEQRTAQILTEQAHAPNPVAAREADGAHLQAAIERLVERLMRLTEEER
jgi:vacuolar-type H+-ATPase subunit H